MQLIKLLLKHKAVYLLLAITTLLTTVSKTVSADSQTFSTLDLKNDIIQLTLTPDIGGRITHFSLIGFDNFLKVGDAFKQGISPEISPFADNIGYLGHIAWVGPQSQWWQQQSINTQRRKEQAQWPPDPYTIFATNKVIRKNNNLIQLQGINSPITGLRIDKEISLNPQRPHQINVKTVATNITDQKVSWDLWFNSRVHGDTYIIAPVAHKDDVKINSLEQATVGAIAVDFIENKNARYNDYWVEFDVEKLNRDKLSNQGKIFIQPNQGWLAGFNKGQLFIIEFPWHARKNIHPEHGQIEIYANYQPQSMENSLIEMEFHSPYKILQPNKSMSVTAKWHLFSYPTSWHRKQLVAFLQQKIKKLKYHQ